MKIVTAGYERITEKDPIKKIEQVARVCYKSEDKICDGSAKKMVRGLIKRGHEAMLEHASLVISFDANSYFKLRGILDWLQYQCGYNSFLRFTSITDYLVSGNLRAWREFLSLAMNEGFEISTALESILRSPKYDIFFEDIVIMTYEDEGTAEEIDPQTLTGIEREIHDSLTVKFIVDRGVSHEIVRHRVASFAQESTRYCNYGKSREVSFIRPCFFEEFSPEMDNWVDHCMMSERDYLVLLAMGRTPHEARSILPNSLKTELVMTANLKEWKHFFELRAVGTTGKPHPQMLEVAVPLMKECKRLIPDVFDYLEAGNE